jgi:D-alanyl-D-alanine carboxypeptidase (penicillin-binding protein 5/6)
MRFLVFLLCLCLAATARAQFVPQPPTVAAKSWLLLDYATGQPLAAFNPDERVEPASLTKLMTAYLVFAALKQKALAPEQVVPVSERAWKTQGSRMFIEPRKPVTVDELLRGMIVQSGNDACVALAEAVAGSEESFVQMMNREAQRLGLKNTRFTNATGLSDPQHYSTARDLALLAAALIRDFPDYYPLYSLKDYTYNRITQPNRNRLLWLDPTVDGVKTGHTEAAGYCLVASGKRGSRRLISVVMGTASDGLRAQESQKLLNFGFQFYDAVKLYAKGQAVSELRVWKGAANTVKAGFLEDFTLSLPKGAAEKIKASLVSRQPLLAPVQPGQPIATLKLTLDDKPYGEYPVVALEAVPVAGMFGRAWDTLRLWFE